MSEQKLPITLDIAGTACPLVMDGDVMERIEELTGVSYMKGRFMPTTAGETLSITWCLVRQTLPKITREELGETLSASRLKELVEVIGSLIADVNEEGLIAPYVPTSPEVLKEIGTLLTMARKADGSQQWFLDLGCGQAETLLLAQAKGFKVKGFELNQDRAKFSQAAVNEHGMRGHVYQEDMLDEESHLIEELLAADVVYVYLLNRANRLLRPILEANMKPGSLLITQDFPLYVSSPTEDKPDMPFGLKSASPIVLYEADGETPKMQHYLFTYEKRAKVNDLGNTEAGQRGMDAIAAHHDEVVEAQ